jgi:YidC/Oxa1 family membrane protein insertase
LKWLNRYIGNFGWAIIVLTVVINLVLFPLRLKQQVSMLKMQKLQPQMRRLQDQYKKLKPTDPRRTQVQTEMMGLYKEHGVNPMGGCLPLHTTNAVSIRFL